MGPVERQHENEASTVGPDVFVVRSLRDFWQLPETGRSRIDAQCVQNQLPAAPKTYGSFQSQPFKHAPRLRVVSLSSVTEDNIDE